MRAMILQRVTDLAQDQTPLQMVEMPPPEPQAGELLLKVDACGVCHTELDIIEGRTPPGRLPLIPGHQVIGRVWASGSQNSALTIGTRVGVAWIYSACGECAECRRGNENLCAQFKATGRDAHGGYAEWMAVPQAFVYPIPEIFSDAEAAPLLCAGAIGYRSLRLAGVKNGAGLGLIGFGASAHLVLLTVRYLYPDSKVFVFTRSASERSFALDLGAAWAGEIDVMPPQLLDAVIDTTPVWKSLIAGLAALKPGGRLVINAIRKQTGDQAELLRLNYPTHLWMEKEIKSVANVTRLDVREFLELAGRIPIRPRFQEYALDDANTALIELKTGKIHGAKVLRINR